MSFIIIFSLRKSKLWILLSIINSKLSNELQFTFTFLTFPKQLILYDFWILGKLHQCCNSSGIPDVFFKLNPYEFECKKTMYRIA